jgi:cytoskeletal protein CcmA (bactofilin family)
MFTKKPDKEPVAFETARTAAPQRAGPASQPPRPAARGDVSQISADLTIIGNLVSKGEVHIDGEIQGDLHAASVVVGENARITGSVVADEVMVRGTVMGAVRGRRVILQSTSKIEGDVFHQQLAIEQGAYFEGKSRRVDDPTAGVQRPEFAPPASNGHAA